MYGTKENRHNIDGLVQDCSNSSALAMELLQSCTKLSICRIYVDGLAQDCSNSSALAMELLQSYTKPSNYVGYMLMA